MEEVWGRSRGIELKSGGGVGEGVGEGVGGGVEWEWGK